MIVNNVWVVCRMCVNHIFDLSDVPIQKSDFQSVAQARQCVHIVCRCMSIHYNCVPMHVSAYRIECQARHLHVYACHMYVNPCQDMLLELHFIPCISCQVRIIWFSSQSMCKCLLMYYNSQIVNTCKDACI
jgi:hypothetical protein